MVEPSGSRGSTSLRLAAALACLAVLVAGVLLYARLGPGASPAGSPLALATEPLPSFTLPPGAAWGCPNAGLVPVRVARSGDSMVFLSTETGSSVEVVWPRGFSARVVGGVAELVDSHGDIIGREGDVLSNLGGGLGASDDAFHVCQVGSKVYLPG